MINQAAIRARSWLFTPATGSDRFANAAAAGADVEILDLEDVKTRLVKPARAQAAGAWAQGPDGGD